MKIKIRRLSNVPLDEQPYRDEFKRLFDIAERIAKDDMERLSRKLATIDKALSAKFPLEAEVDEVVTEQGWKDLMDKYSAPILVAKEMPTGNVVYIIFDEQFGLN